MEFFLFQVHEGISAERKYYFANSGIFIFYMFSCRSNIHSVAKIIYHNSDQNFERSLWQIGKCVLSSLCFSQMQVERRRLNLKRRWRGEITEDLER